MLQAKNSISHTPSQFVRKTRTALLILALFAPVLTLTACTAQPARVTPTEPAIGSGSEEDEAQGADRNRSLPEDGIGQ